MFTGSLAKIFNYGESPVRVVMQNESPWFVAADVAKILELGNPRSSIALLDDDEKGVHTVDTPGGAQQLAIINESGVYSLVLRSRKPEAKAFKRWITHEVLPDIRKHGMYMKSELVEEFILNPDTMIDVLNKYKEEKEKRIAAEDLLHLQTPKVIFADAVTECDGTISMADLACFLNQNGVNIGQNRLYDWLRKQGYLGTRPDKHNRPTQKAMNLGLFTTKESIFDYEGTPMITLTTRVTGHGQVYFINKLLNTGKKVRRKAATA